MVRIVRCSTWAGIMFNANTICKAKVVNLELNSRKKQYKNGKKTELLKSSFAVDAVTLFRVAWRPYLHGTARSSKPANLSMSVIKT